jgi:formyltetrahydrofolate hydrolase
MKVVLLTGSHIRHSYIAHCAAESGCLSALVIEERENTLPLPPMELDSHLKTLFQRHFADRLAAEKKFFGGAELPDIPVLRVTKDSLNSPDTVKFINQFHTDLVLSYGVHKLNSDVLKGISSSLKWNIHGGLSPWYRGNTTHFWPSYFLEPQMTGMTVHELTDNIDGGGIIHQTVASLVRGDGIHDLACRAVMSLGEVVGKLFSITEEGALADPKTQTTSGRIWRGVDWRPEHLRLIYDFYDNSIVNRYLDGDFTKYDPKLVTQF